MKSILRICLGTFIALFSLTSIIFAQEGASSASIARSRAIANANQNRFVAPDEVAVEEFVNYHRHRLPLPKSGKSVAMDTRWGNSSISPYQSEAVLQIGFTTGSSNDRTNLHPVNLSLVIDKSGSMAASDKMSRVKESLLKMIDQLRPNDIISIVAYDHAASVLLSATRVGNGQMIKNSINSLRPGGSTNLHAGLILGYKEAQKNFQKNSTNRVILLTDGIANTGVTDPKAIALESSEYNGQGIDLTTIGVGLQLDRNLLRTLSKQGRGLFHFVADAHDINKVFVKEVQSLISPVARKVNLQVGFGATLKLEKVYGYEPKFGRNMVSIPIDDMNSGLTQVVLMKFKVTNYGKYRGSLPVNIKLSYTDANTGKRIVETQTAKLRLTRNSSANFLADSVVKKNYTIAELAQSLFEMSESAKTKNYRRGENLLNASVSNAYNRYPNMEDKDIRFVLKIVESYQHNLRSYNQKAKKNTDGS